MPDVANAELDAAQNAILNNATTYYMSLHTADPGQTGANEGPDGREAITFGASSSGNQASSNGQTWPSVAGGHTYTNFGIWTAASGGSFLRGGALTAPISPPAASEVVFVIGAITFSAD